ncbi:MAG: RidA family protein [Geminicoccaceae bacterium]
MTPLTHLNPDMVPAPLANYSHGVRVAADTELLFLSGQVALAERGEVPDGIDAQCEQVFRTIEALLESAGMAMADIVRLNAYLTERSHLPAYMAARARFVASPPPASTLLLVQGFARPEFLVEVVVIAAKR